MTDDLKALIEKARHYEMTDEERREQLISMAYGNGHYDNPNITMGDIRAGADRIDAERRGNGSVRGLGEGDERWAIRYVDWLMC